MASLGKAGGRSIAIEKSLLRLGASFQMAGSSSLKPGSIFAPQAVHLSYAAGFNQVNK